MDLDKIDEIHELLDEFSDVRIKLKQLANILDTDRNNKSKRNVCGFMVSPELYYRIFSDINDEYVAHYEQLKSKLQ